MGIKHSILKRFGRRKAESAPSVRWRHGKWPAREISQLVVSFPKSGRTWLRVLMGAAEGLRKGLTVEEEVGVWLSQEVPLLDGRPLLFTHALSEEGAEPLAHLDLFQRYVGEQRRVFLMRDPRDVVVSYYHQRVKREDRPAGLPTDLPSFVREPDYGIDRILNFMATCARAMEVDPGPHLCLSYEELHRDAVGCLGRVLAFFDVGPLDAAVLEGAVEYGRFENMRRLETSNTLAKTNDKLRAIDVDDPDTFKTRKGTVGSHADELGASELAYVEERIAHLLPESLGYRSPGAFGPG